MLAEALSGRQSLGAIGLFRAAPCDPNLLGFASDIAEQVAGVDCCVVYCEQATGLKLSIRSGVREMMANESAGFLCRGAGSGGGNLEKAGGFISYGGVAAATGGSDGRAAAEGYLRGRIRAYQENYDHIWADNRNIPFDTLPRYRKLPRPVGYAKSADIFAPGTKIAIRTLEGGVDTVVGGGVYLMIGVRGEAYPILAERFEASYSPISEPYGQHAEYAPAVIDRDTGDRKEILPYARACVPKGEKIIRAAPLTRDTKVFFAETYEAM